MLSPGTDAYDPSFTSYKYDPEAKKLLAEAGHADRLKLIFEIPQYGTGEIVETWIQRDLKKVGSISTAQVRVDQPISANGRTTSRRMSA